jgi:hypothetical protein
VCAPAPEAAFGHGLCIAQAGDVACPATGYTKRVRFFAGDNDTRGCSACTCGTVNGATCAGSLTTFTSTDASCAGSPITYQLPFTCDPGQQPGDFRLTLTASGGGCSPSMVTPTGAAVPSQPTTFCCAP